MINIEFEKRHALSEEICCLCFTFPALCSMVVRVLHLLSRLTISRVTSTSASTNVRCSMVPGWRSSSPLIFVLLKAIILALMAAIFSMGIASCSDEVLSYKRKVKHLKIMGDFFKIQNIHIVLKCYFLLYNYNTNRNEMLSIQVNKHCMVRYMHKGQSYSKQSKECFDFNKFLIQNEKLF